MMCIWLSPTAFLYIRWWLSAVAAERHCAEFVGLDMMRPCHFAFPRMRPEDLTFPNISGLSPGILAQRLDRSHHPGLERSEQGGRWITRQACVAVSRCVPATPAGERPMTCECFGSLPTGAEMQKSLVSPAPPSLSIKTLNSTLSFQFQFLFTRLYMVYFPERDLSSSSSSAGVVTRASAPRSLQRCPGWLHGLLKRNLVDYRYLKP